MKPGGGHLKGDEHLRREGKGVHVRERQDTKHKDTQWHVHKTRLKIASPVEEKYSWFGENTHKANELKGELAAG